MKLLTLILMLTTTAGARAEDASTDTSQYGDFMRVKEDALRTRFRLRGDVYVLDAEGKRFVAATSEIREWRPGLKSNVVESFWSVGANGFKPIALHHVWTLNKDNSVDYVIEQCERIVNAKPSRCVNPGRREAKTLENFAPVTWVHETTKDARLVVRFTPAFDEARESEDLGRLSIGGDRGTFDVYDNQGHLWSERTRFGGVVSGLKSPFGATVFSFYPFPGAKEIGKARGKYIELYATDKLTITIRNDEDVVPGDMRVKVYGRYLPKVRNTSPAGGTYSFGHDRAETIPAEFR